MKHCTWCDASIPESKRTDSQFCSNSCRMAAAYARRRAVQQVGHFILTAPQAPEESADE
jgi:predicted nucleic acid-binding Zn ribbon protein